MPETDSSILLGVGGLFIILGLAAMLWGKREEKSYYNALSARHDVREFMEHWPLRPQPGALKIGGWIAVILGFLLLVAGIVLMF